LAAVFQAYLLVLQRLVATVSFNANAAAGNTTGGQTVSPRVFARSPRTFVTTSSAETVNSVLSTTRSILSLIATTSTLTAGETYQVSQPGVSAAFIYEEQGNEWTLAIENSTISVAVPSSLNSNNHSFFSLFVVSPNPFASFTANLLSAAVTFDDPTTDDQDTTSFTYSGSGTVTVKVPYVPVLCVGSNCQPTCQLWDSTAAAFTTTGIITATFDRSAALVTCVLSRFGTFTVIGTVSDSGVSEEANVAIIVGAVVGGAVLLLAIGLSIFFCQKRTYQKHIVTNVAMVETNTILPIEESNPKPFALARASSKADAMPAPDIATTGSAQGFAL